MGSLATLAYFRNQNYMPGMEKIVWREGGKQLRHTYAEMPPEKRPQDVNYEKNRDGPILSRRDGKGLHFAALEHGYDGCPETIIVGDWFRGKATYVVQDRFGETSQRPQAQDIVGRDLHMRRWNMARRTTCHRPSASTMHRAARQFTGRLQKTAKWSIAKASRWSLRAQKLPERVNDRLPFMNGLGAVEHQHGFP
jgi:hypothetical protein